MINFARLGPLAATLAAMGIVLAVISACNTIEGAGQDMQSVGGAVERTADDSK
jgi:predicted small secreted protein